MPGNCFWPGAPAGGTHDAPSDPLVGWGVGRGIIPLSIPFQ